MSCFNESAYDKKTFWQSLWGLFAVVALMKLTGGIGFVAVAFFALLATLKGDVKLMLYWLVVSNCALMGNSWFFPKSLIFGIAQRGMMVLLGLCLAAKVFGGKSYRVLSPFALILPYMFYIIVPSLGGWAPSVSIMKIVLFVLMFMAYVGTAKMALATSGEYVRELRAIVVAAFAFFIFGSVVLFAFPSIGYMGRDEVLSDPRFAQDIAAGTMVSLFKGMTWHSQTLGPLMSMFCLFLLGDMLFNIRKADKLYLSMIAICPVLVYKTSSRTAMAVLICGILAMLVMFQSSRRVFIAWKAKVMNVSFAIFLPLFLAAVSLPVVREGAVRFALKYSSDVDSSTKVELREVMSTRQGLIDEALYNWKKKPIIGNGFQVSEIMQYQKRESLADYISAPIEKGVWVTAILEEGGVIGMILFCLFWIPAVLMLWASGYCGTAALLLSFVIMNMAEFIIFSMSGSGGFVWCVIFLMAILEGKQKEEDARLSAAW